MTKKPRISVVMPAYNCAQYLSDAVDSILNQTFTDFELIVVNDGSTDDTAKILQAYSKSDSRVKVVTQKNGGIVKALNHGIEVARADYIARMDGDDISFPKRFAEQVVVLDNNPNVVLVSGNIEAIDEDGKFLYREIVPALNHEIKRAMYLRNVIAHGSTMMRKTALLKAGLYTTRYSRTEDLELWMRLAQLGDFVSTATPVYKWRMNRGGITLTNNKESIQQTLALLAERWQAGHPEFLSRKKVMEIADHYRFSYGKLGPFYKEQFLIDTSQIAVKLILHGYVIDGVKQLFVVASTGRTGLRAVLKRFSLVIAGHRDAILRKLNFTN